MLFLRQLILQSVRAYMEYLSRTSYYLENFLNPFAKLGRLLVYFNIDVVFGAIGVNLMVQELMAVEGLPLIHYIALGAAVFCIYAIDRLMDVRKMDGEPATKRHTFYLKYYKLIWPVVLIVIFWTGLAVMIWMPTVELLYGVFLGIAVGVYLLLTRYLQAGTYRWFHKEVLVAILYTTGCWGSIFIYCNTIEWYAWALCFAFFLIALYNLMLFSLFEIDVDVQHKQRSLGRTLGPKQLEYILWVMAACILVLTGLILAYVTNLDVLKVVIIEVLMTAMLCTILGFKHRFQKHEYYRLAADGVFFNSYLMLL
jgi:4-hydroxybenzoate polyprenyltransferase